MNLALALVVYSVAALGLAYIVGASTISLRFRIWLAGKQFARCPACGDTLDAKFADGFKCDGSQEFPHPGVPFQLIAGSAWRHWLVTLLECPACCGFWTGLVAAPFLVAIFAPPRAGWWAFAAPALALYTAGSNFLFGRATGLMPDPSKE